MFNRMNIFLSCFATAVLVAPLCIQAGGATRFIDDVSDPLEDGSSEHPFDTIQEGINTATNGDRVLVQDGTYIGIGNRDLDLLGKTLVVESSSGPSNTILDCQSAGRGFYFHSGETTNCRVSGFRICNGKAIAGAGIACFSNSSPVIENCEVVTNRAWNYNYTDTIGSPGDAFYRVMNLADGNGGGIYCESSGPTIRDCLIQANETGGHGGGICCVSNSNLKIENSTLWANHSGLSRTTTVITIGTPGDSFYQQSWDIVSAGLGGGVYGTNVIMTVENSEIHNNEAGVGGGGVYVIDSRLTLLGSSIRDNRVSDNYLPGSGGGVSCINTFMTMSNCQVTSNRAGQTTVRRIMTIGSPADSFYRQTQSTVDKGLGGGLCVSLSSVTIDVSSIRGNVTYNEGGGIHLSSNINVQISSTSFENNKAATMNSIETTVIKIPGVQTRTTVISLADGGSGGGVFSDQTTPALSGCLLSRNVAGSLGGGLCNFGGTPLIQNCFVIDNNAGETVTQVLVQAKNSITNVSIFRSGVGEGGGIYFARSQPFICGSTIAGNLGADGIHCTLASTSRIMNSILWSNSLFVSIDSIITAGYSCIESDYQGTGLVTANPLLTVDWRLTSLSPCIDAGILSAASPTDFDGESRWDHPTHSNTRLHCGYRRG